MTIAVSAFYKFVTIENPPALRLRLQAELAARAIRGTILVAPEGINGTISGTPESLAAFLAALRSEPLFSDIVTKDAVTASHPFRRLKVKLKREIISLRCPDADPTRRVGTYVKPEHWNALVRDPDVLLLDTRNAYEVAAGTFKGAVDPRLAHFTDWPAYVEQQLAGARDRKIAMFCTGGIRCEKASAFLLAKGFDQVYHLQGGILAYLATVPAKESLWQGRCFVFDERETVDAATAAATLPQPEQ